MRRGAVIEGLRRYVRSDGKQLWSGIGALMNLYPGVDPKLVERAMKLAFQREITAVIRRLPDEFVELANRVIAKVKTAEATFVRSYDGDLRDAGDWLSQVRMIDRKPRHRPRLAHLCRDDLALAAARTTVVAHGLEIEQLVAILAHDGSRDSVDALVDVVHAAITERDERLDVLAEWFAPFARGKHMTALAGELAESVDERGARSPLLALAERFGDARGKLALDVSVKSRQVMIGLTRKASFWVVLSSHALPNAAVSVTWNTMNHKSTRWEDGRTKRDENRLGAPRSVDDIPRYLAACAKKLKITWDWSSALVASSLRGKARTAALGWLAGS